MLYDKLITRTINYILNHISNLLSTIKLPISPGIYIFKDKAGLILYVGKAKKLRSRVSSYFKRATELSPAKQMMVKRIADIETIITSSETEALILESNLIKKHQPPYNIVLKDDKNYQFIKIDYRLGRPTVTTVRRPEIDRGRSQARYFGPFTSGFALQESLRLLRRVFPYRKQDKELTRFEKDLLKKRTLGLLPKTDEEYKLMINRLIRVLEGASEEVIADLKKWMAQLSAQKNYEQAGRVRDQIKALEIINSRQKMVSVHGESQDIISLWRQADLVAVNLFVVRAGKLIDKRNFLLQHATDENDVVVLDAFLTQYYSATKDLPKEIIIPVPTSLSVFQLNNLEARTPSDSPSEKGRFSSSPPPRGGVRGGAHENIQKISMPSHGKKRDLIKLGETNARDYLEHSLPTWQKNKHEAELKELQSALKLDCLPTRIEGYDIANIQGQWAVGSMVVFTNGEPDKKEYRKFKIKTVKGANDYAMLAEVLKRRFTKTNWSQPDLILLDGGKGQLSTVLLETRNSQLETSKFISLAKRAEEVFQGPDGQKINIIPTSSASKLLQRIRDEAHRFAQAYYHSRHSRANIKSQLDDVPGIGPKTKKLLIQKFGSLANVKQADKNDIIKLLGKVKAKKLLENI